MSWEAVRDAIRAALDAGDVDRALELAADLESTPRAHRLAAAIADAAIDRPEARTVRLKVLRSFTAEPLIDALRARALADRLVLDVAIAGHGQLEQEIVEQPVDESIDAVIVATRLVDLVPDLGRGFAALAAGRAIELTDAVLDRAEGWLAGLRRCHPRALLILCGFALPATPSYGIADRAVELGHRRAVERLNDRLAAIAGERAGAVFVDVDAALAAVGYHGALDPRTDAVARQPLAPPGIDALARTLARVLGAGFAPRRKCLVLDCDHTLWGGVIGEDGIEGISLGPEYPGSAFVELQRAVLDLASRGVILALASKNNEADVLEVLDDHPHQVLRREHFAAWRIDWSDKAANLESLAAELDIGTDSLVLFDDSDFECELVRQRLPEVLVVRAPAEPLELAPALDALRCFDTLGLSDTDRQRGAMYRAQAERNRARVEAPSLAAFLGSLELRLAIEPTGAGQIERAAQLTQRTNQLNATTRRYTAADIEALIADSDVDVLHVRVADRFGDHGVCGLAIVRRGRGDEAELDTLLVSCRVIGRGVEDALVAAVEDRARDAGSAWLIASYRPTAKNAPVSDLFDRLGFERIAENDAAVRYRRNLDAVRSMPPWFAPYGKIDG